MAPGARNKFGAHMFEPEGLSEANEVLVTLLGLFGAPRSHSAPS